MKRTFDFETNIERRSPWTGNVYMVDRMTSEYAERFPLDVDGFLEAVYQKWADCETVGFRETREALRRQWTRTLGVTRPSGDASIYPNQGGEHHPALMEVWGMAGDYWRRGFRLGDVLPAIVPSHTITRLGDGEWIALFPKDMGLLDTVDSPSATTEGTVPVSAEPVEVEPTPMPVEEPTAIVEPEPAPVRRHRRNRQRPTPPAEPDLFAQQEESGMSDDTKRKIVCGLATAAVMLVLLNTVGLFGIAALGLIAGGVVK